MSAITYNTVTNDNPEELFWAIGKAVRLLAEPNRDRVIDALSKDSWFDRMLHAEKVRYLEDAMGSLSPITVTGTLAAASTTNGALRLAFKDDEHGLFSPTNVPESYTWTLDYQVESQ